MSKLHRISGCDKPDRRADVLFLHGLGGDAFKTWRHGSDDSTYWPSWLGSDHSDVGVWSLGYPDPDNAGWQRDLWVSHSKLGKILSQGEPIEAMKHLDICHDILADMITRNLFVSDQDQKFYLYLCQKLGTSEDKDQEA